MKKLIIASIIASSLSANDFMDSSFWQEEDKQKHYTYSVAMSATATAVARSYGSSKIEAFFIGLGTSVLVGWAKEARDGRGYGHKSMEDMDADVLGSFSGAFASTQFSWKF